MTAFIMCQGEQRRLAHLGYPKQLIPINSEPILHRTMRLLADYSVEEVPWVIGAEALVEDYEGPKLAQGPKLAHSKLPDPGWCVLDGMLATLVAYCPLRELLRELAPPTGWAAAPPRITFLLGDVVWSRAALHGFLADKRPVVFAGTTELHGGGGEVFAAAFDPPFDSLVDLLRRAPCRIGRSGEPINWKIQQGGHLRRLLWQYMLIGEKPERGDVQQWHPDFYYQVTDWTTDIDDDGDLSRLPEIEKHVRAER